MEAEINRSRPRADIACAAAQTITADTVAEIKVRLAEDEPAFDIACAYRLPPAVVAAIQSGAAWGQMCWWEAENICRGRAPEPVLEALAGHINLRT